MASLEVFLERPTMDAKNREATPDDPTAARGLYVHLILLFPSCFFLRHNSPREFIHRCSSTFRFICCFHYRDYYIH